MFKCSKIKILKKLNFKYLPYITGKINKTYTNNVVENNKILNLYFLNKNNFNYFKYIFNLKKEKINLKKFIISNYYNIFNINSKKLYIILFNLGLSKTIYQSFNIINHKFIFLNFKFMRCPKFICKNKDLISVNKMKFNKYIIYKNIVNMNIYNVIKNKNKFNSCYKDMKFKLNIR